MIHSIRFTCVLKTNVMYPLWICDLLLWFAYHELYTPKWSKHIFYEYEVLDIFRRNGLTDTANYLHALF